MQAPLDKGLVLLSDDLITDRAHGHVPAVWNEWNGQWKPSGPKGKVPVIPNFKRPWQQLERKICTAICRMSWELRSTQFLSALHCRICLIGMRTCVKHLCLTPQGDDMMLFM